MSPCEPDVIYVAVNCACKKAPCPHCGKLGKLIRTHNRPVRTIAYHKVAWLDVTYGEYRAGCLCCKTFCNTPEQVLPKAKYDNKVRQAVIDRLIDDGMNVESILRARRARFLAGVVGRLRLRLRARHGETHRVGGTSPDGAGDVQRYVVCG